MKRLFVFFSACSVLLLSGAAPAHQDAIDHPEEKPQAEKESHYNVKYDRCEGIEFDAIALDEKGTTLFFNGNRLWKGFSGPAELANGTFQELDENHHLGHVDAAFRMHNKDDKDSKHHDHVIFFLDDKVFSYYNGTLEKGFPQKIQQVFPGVPDDLDAAVECPEGECKTDSVLFFKGHEVSTFDIKTNTVKKRVWDHLPVCTSAFRWLEHYYCFHGHNFTRFNPVTGEVEGNYPKETRRYFMRCANIGHGDGHRRPSKLDAITRDSTGKSYAFMGEMYIRLDTQRDGFHAFPIVRSWKEVKGHVDAVFSYDGKIYIIQGDQIYIYKSAAHYTLIKGYPKPLEEELGIKGPVDAAFVCNEHVVHVIQGQKMLDIDLEATPRAVKAEAPLTFPKIDAAMCGADGVKVYVGAVYYQYRSPKELATSKINPLPHKIASEIFG